MSPPGPEGVSPASSGPGPPAGRPKAVRRPGGSRSSSGGAEPPTGAAGALGGGVRLAPARYLDVTDSDENPEGLQADEVTEAVGERRVTARIRELQRGMEDEEKRQKYAVHAKAVRTCGRSGGVGTCECGETVVHVLHRGGRAMCATCGQVGSEVHMKRAKRVGEKVLWGRVLGQLVLTIPPNLRPWFSEPEDLSSVQSGFMDDLGGVTGWSEYTGAATRWHLFGDEGDTYHPHLNVLVPLHRGDGYLPRETLRAIKWAWARALEDHTGEEIPTQVDRDGCRVPEVSIHWSYASEAGKRWHRVRYTTRPTVGSERWLRLPEGLQRLALDMQGHRVTYYWRLSSTKVADFISGVRFEWTQDYRRELEWDEGDNEEPEECEECGTSVWSRFFMVDWVSAEAWEVVGRGMKERIEWMDLPAAVRAPPNMSP